MGNVVTAEILEIELEDLQRGVLYKVKRIPWEDDLSADNLQEILNEADKRGFHLERIIPLDFERANAFGTFEKKRELIVIFRNLST